MGPHIVWTTWCNTRQGIMNLAMSCWVFCVSQLHSFNSFVTLFTETSSFDLPPDSNLLLLQSLSAYFFFSTWLPTNVESNWSIQTYIDGSCFPIGPVRFAGWVRSASWELNRTDAALNILHARSIRRSSLKQHFIYCFWSSSKLFFPYLIGW